MSTRWIAAMVGVLALLSAQAASAHTKKLDAGPISKPKLRQFTLNAYYRNAVTVHTGDSVQWNINGFHTVTFPQAGRSAPPFFVPTPADPVRGVLDAAGRPFWFNGMPNLQLNPAAAFPSGGPSFDGSAYTNSGLPIGPAAGKPYVLKFTKRGLFRYICLTHPGMAGSVTVVGTGASVPSAKSDDKAARREQSADLKRARKLAKVKTRSTRVLAGHDMGAVTFFRFFPQKLTVHAGQTVEFDQSSRSEYHTITVGPAAYDSAIENSFIQVKPQPGGPPAAVANPLGAYASDPGNLPAFNGANHGNGFLNSGLLSLGGAFPSKSKVRFTKRGTYHFECVVHKGMDGTIKVI